MCIGKTRVQDVHWETWGEGFLDRLTVRGDSDLKFCTSCALLPVRTVRGCWLGHSWMAVTAEMLRRL